MSVDRGAEMQYVLQKLRNTYAQALANRPVKASAPDLVTFGLFALLTGKTISFSSTADAYDRAVFVAGQALRLLEGTEPAYKWGNLWDAALVNDAAFLQWADLAQETIDNLHRASNLVSKWNVFDFLTLVARDTGKNLTPSNTTLGISAAILFAIVLILVLR